MPNVANAFVKSLFEKAGKRQHKDHERPTGQLGRTIVGEQPNLYTVAIEYQSY